VIVPPATALAKKTCPRCLKSFDGDAAFCPTDGTALEPPGAAAPDQDPYIGKVIHGDIEIKSVAGVGAMGRVYRAHQRGIDRDVAVKILHRELSGNLPLVQRFHREAKIASKLQHPHVVDVYLAGQLDDGMSLAAALAAAGGTLPLERAIPIALQVCDAVGEGHMRGIVHRDLKPENVMLVRRAETSDWVKVLDFGIAKVSLGDQSMETAAGMIFGTARYISPEGAQGATVTPPGDVYSIAVMIYQLLAGRTPFDAEQPVGLLIKHIHEPPPPLRAWPAACAVPEPIARAVMDNLVKDPTRRAPSARAFGNAIAAAAKEANVSFSDIGVVARMSMPELAVPRSGRIEPTLDDAAAQPPPAILMPNATPTSQPPISDPLAETSPVEPTPKEVSQPPPPAKVAEPERKEQRQEGRRGVLALVALAFALGAALALLLTQHIGHRRDVERDAHLDRTRRALAEGRYVSPPGDNVRDLVAAGAKRWPNDSELPQFQNHAAHELVTRAMAARSTGDLGQARDLVKIAIELDPSDHAATVLLDQYQDELTFADGGAGALGAPRVLLDVPVGKTRPGQRAHLVATLVVGGGPPKGAVGGPRFTVTGPGLPTAGNVVPASPTGQGKFEAAVLPPRAGTYEIVFEAFSEGIPFRAERSLEVAP
jgi:eukaryotic-like serine/threonine-protein kinase